MRALIAIAVGVAVWVFTRPGRDSDSVDTDAVRERRDQRDGDDDESGTEKVKSRRGKGAKRDKESDFVPIPCEQTPPPAPPGKEWRCHEGRWWLRRVSEKEPDPRTVFDAPPDDLTDQIT